MFRDNLTTTAAACYCLTMYFLETTGAVASDPYWKDMIVFLAELIVLLLYTGMADSSNKARLDQQQPQQPLLTSQLLTVSSAASTFAANGLSATRSGTPVIVRTTAASPGLTRNLVVIRPSTVTASATPSAPRFFVQSGSSRPILPQLDNPSPLDGDNQPDASNAPVATLLRNAPITMRFDGHSQSVSAVPVASRLSLMKGPTVGSGGIAAARVRLGAVAEVAGSAAQPLNRKIIREMQVRVCPRADRKLSVLRYNVYDRIDLTGPLNNNAAGDSKSGSSSLPEVFIQRENNLRQYKASHNIVDAPTRGAGSEFGQEAREEARLRKLGIVRQGYRAEDQPWLLTVGKGRTAKRYRGVKEGSVSANVRHFVFCQTKDGNFDAYPVHEWYKFSPEITYRYLRDDEAEAEFSRRHKTMNLFNVMVKRKMADEAAEEAVGEGSEARSKSRSGTKSDKSTKRDRSSALLLTELDEWKDLGADDEEEEEEGAEGIGTGDAEGEKAGELGEGGEAGFPKKSDESEKKTNSKKRRAAAIVARKRRATKQRARRRRKGAIGNSSDEEDDVNEEAWDESDPDDHEGDEVDYMTDSSSDEEKLSEDDREQIYQEQGVDEEAGLKALLTDMSDSEEEQQNKPDNSNPDNFDEDGDDGAEDVDDKGEHDYKLRSGELKSRRGKTGFSDSSSNEDDSDDSSDDSSSDSSSSSASDSDVAPDDPARLARKAQKRAELSQRTFDKASPSTSLPLINDQSNSGATPKRPLEDSNLISTAASDSPPKRPKLADPATDDAFIAAVRKYLMRKPISVAELLKKIRSKRLVPHSSQIGRNTGVLGTDDVAETMLANALRQLRPLKHIINGQPVLSLKR
ncbi:General transcription factor IIF subunit 1 [Taenia crassiceps]|uniref:General transcription factor IIF subunit 1 n=1 Tax=Taenia crassiceps TaxID=6207 RepID=A0ABR4QGD9_9CEST